MSDDTPTPQGAPAPIELPPLPDADVRAVKVGMNPRLPAYYVESKLIAYARTHEANVRAALAGEVERLRNALARVVDTDWAYLGRDADTANPDSLYNRVRDGRKALGGAR